ncbi:MAG: 4Fe-4S ferredoxin [Chloroflexi bacterium CG23_combo_of_CG06-09_8_20_14_all_45_10]|nr:MAG: 4Fe-4S ferredoxin [Chloroflexi bacterium CG23_combo_of_CG06-09_8_20_14_all_45_10]
MEEPRIGVFVCHCGINIGAYVDVPKVVEYVKTLPNVAHAERNLFTCSEEGISAIKKGIKEFNLNRVIVASCTPRTHEPLFRAACEEAGLNKYLFEFVNIRDQCSWVHMREPEEATQKAKDLIRMGVAKARLLQPMEEIEIPVTPAALVMGGGVTGMSAALNLANQGFEVHLVEKEKELGGTLLSVNRLFTTNEDASKLIGPLVRKVRAHSKIKTYLSTKVKDVSGFIGNFDVTLGPSTDKGGRGEGLLSKENKIKTGTIIVATGAEVLKPLGQYGYGKFSNVVTQLELEEEMKTGKFAGQNVVMINCVGARVPERTYCSRICCMTAIKNASLIKENNHKAKVWILHRDLMTYGVDFESYYRKSMEQGVRFVRYDLEKPPQVIGNGKAEKVKVWHQLMGREVELPVDMVVLTTPLIPRADNEEISKMLKVPLSEQGFFLEAHLKLMPVEFATDGIYICGSARWPTDTVEGIAQAYAAAAKAAIPLRRGYVKPEAITSFVDEDMCSGCGICVPLCPYKAMELQGKNGKKVAHSITALCKGCGTCGAACPAGAITMNHFRDIEIMAQIEALVV